MSKPERKQRPITGRERIPGTNLLRTPKGERWGGRQKGTGNKIKTAVKQSLHEAMEKMGSDGKGKDGTVGFFIDLYKREPVAFTTLVKAIIPLQLQGTLDVNHSAQNEQDEGMDYKALEKVLLERGVKIPSLIDVTPGSAANPIKKLEGVR